MPTCATFPDATSAIAHQHAYGGWLFLPVNTAEAHWFCATRFTPSAIFTHPLTKGLSGCLV